MPAISELWIDYPISYRDEKEGSSKVIITDSRKEGKYRMRNVKRKEFL